jgi:alkanesulfonate monooxygenase SsuD/methylene tetrahydromethanopterin reductase-like flavin-dependent oxidoreductase (luciferase family)
LTPILAGSSSAQAVQTSVELAMLADRLGYHRVWYAEHHNSPGLASGAPEIMIEHVASRTSRIRVGAGARHRYHHRFCHASLGRGADGRRLSGTIGRTARFR